MSLPSVKNGFMRLLGGGESSAQSDDLNMDVDRTIRRGFLLLSFGLGGFLLWATLAPLDEGVPVSGLVTVDTKRKTIQHPVGGIIEQVLVKEGQSVKAGDTLMTLNDAATRADFESVRQRYLGLRAMESRLLAQQAGKKSVTFHPDVMAEEKNPLVQQHIQTQSNLFKSRQAALANELASLSEAIQGQEAALAGYQDQLIRQRNQLTLTQNELTGLRGLVQEGYAPRNKQWELERQELQVLSSISELGTNITKSQRGIAELKMRQAQREQEARKETESQLADVQREVAADAERFKSTGNDLARTRIKAPVAGYVVGIANQTIGGVIAPGARIMDIIPKNESLILEAQLPPHLIDHIKSGQPADVHFTGFVGVPELVVEGSLVSVSADLLSDPVSNQPYFLARIAITAEGMKQLAAHPLQPGMPAEIVIKTGERTLLRYLLDPLLKRMTSAMKES